MRLIFLGDLAPSENVAVQEGVLNFVLIKFLFIGVVVQERNNVEEVQELLVWVVWFLIAGTCRGFAILSRARLDLVFAAPSRGRWLLPRVIVLQCLITAACAGGTFVSVSALWGAPTHTILLWCFDMWILSVDLCRTWVHILLYWKERSSSQQWDGSMTWMSMTTR